MRRIDAPALAAKQGERLATGLSDIPEIVSVRGRGLLLGAELADRPAADVARALLDDGLVVNPVTPTALRLAPPITVSDAEIDEALAIIREVLGRRRA
jgi:acetylornithine/N-succinyldiaminopimelate aminotransferase